MGLLMTPTLLDSVDWLTDCPVSWKDSAYKSLRNTLAREEFIPTVPIKQGQKFESVVYDRCNMPIDEIGGSDKFRDVCMEIRGMGFQKKINRHITVDGHEFFLFGRVDAWQPPNKEYPTGIIKDIKTTAKYRGKSSYYKKWQHKFYCFIEQCRDFRYIIVEWVSDDNFTIKDVHKADYHVDEPELLSATVESGIRNFLSFLDGSPELKELYFGTYQPAWKR